jgi:hypothetical protein
MDADDNKAVVRRFMHEVLAGGNLDVADEVLAPDYVNVAMGGADRASLKAMVAAISAALKQQRFEDEEFAADGDAVFARFNDTAERSLPVLGVLPAEALALLPRGQLVSVGRDSAGGFQHPGQMHQVPAHEGGVAVGELVLGTARARIEI